MENVNDSVNQTEENSVLPENKIETSSNVDKYKTDMFRYKNEARELKEKLAQIELEKQQKKGNFEGVISKLKEDLQLAKQNNAKLEASFAEKALDDAIQRNAMSKGLKGQQLEAFMKLIDHNAKGVVEFDESFNVKNEDVSNLVEDHMKRYGDLFNRKVNVVDQAPNNNPINRPTKTFDMKTATAEETIAYLLENKDKLK